MSLMDALFEEAAPFEYWIVAGRSDGSKGSGTQSPAHTTILGRLATSFAGKTGITTSFTRAFKI
jgi:hypothetical protein